MSFLSQPHFHNENAAYRRLEKILWPNGPVCVHCGNCEPKRIRRIRGESARAGLLRCNECGKQFRATVGTVFEHSKIPLHKWFQAAHLIASGKKGISAHQIHRTLKITYKSAWFMMHRLREAMRSGDLAPLGGEGKTVEADETFIAQMRGRPVTKGVGNKRKVLTLIERGGKARSFHVEDLAVSTLNPIIRKNIAKESAFMTDEAIRFKGVGREFASHDTVDHSKEEYARGAAHVNTAEGFFALFKRGMRGVYQHCGEQHLHRYLAEFDFRYNNRTALGIDDPARADILIGGIVGRRLTYRDSSAW